MSGIRKRSQATRTARPGPGAHPRAAPVVPADRDDRHRVAATAGQVDELDVEDDARDPLPREEVVRRGPREALEPALRVLDGADDPDRGQHVEDLAEQPPVRRLGRAHVAAVGLDPRSERDVVVLRARPPCSGSWSGGVAMSASAKTIRSEVAASIPLRTAAPLPPCGTDRSRSRGVASSGTCASGARRDERGRGIGAAVVDDQHLDPLGEAGRTRAPRPARARRRAAGSRTARRAPGRCGPPRRRPAGRWSGWRAGTSAEVYGTGRRSDGPARLPRAIGAPGRRVDGGCAGVVARAAASR